MLQRFGFGVLAVLSIALGGCTVKQTDTPSLTGPSTFATSLTVTATPDSINQDGVSQAAIVVTARDASGQPLAALPVLVEMFVGSVQKDFGTLLARNLVTASNGQATTVYTAPPAPPPGSAGAVTTVSIVATPVGSNAQSSAVNTTSANIRLVPQGVITPVGGTPTASFTISPTSVNQNSAASFDASSSLPGTGATTITSYAWSFGDGSTGSGIRVSHSFAAAGTFNVTLTVTNNLGVQGSTSQGVIVLGSAPPTGTWVYSPAGPVVNQSVIFNATGLLPAPGLTIVQYSWDFGDGATGSGVLTTHVYTQANVYTVVLSVLDSAGQKVVIPQVVTVATGDPVPVVTFSPGTPIHPATVGFSASSSTFFSGATAASYSWNFGDPGSGINNTSTASAPSHTFNLAGTYTVQVTITDSQGRSGTASITVTVT